MVMIGGNCRNAGKTTLACSIIQKISVNQKVVALKVTSVRPGEAELHGNHKDVNFSGFEIFEETNPDIAKDTSRMLRAGANRVFYIQANEGFIEKAIMQFLARYNNNQPIVCESRSLRSYVSPGLFLMMMRIPAVGSAKDVTQLTKIADKVLAFSEDQAEINQSVAQISFENQKFIF
jgi:hypothetical protein